jgi:hypothetical protein
MATSPLSTSIRSLLSGLRCTGLSACCCLSIWFSQFWVDCFSLLPASQAASSLLPPGLART